MITLNLTLAKPDKYFSENILLIDHTDTVNYTMEESNINTIEKLLPVKYRDRVILSIEKIKEIITIDKEQSNDQE